MTYRDQTYCTSKSCKNADCFRNQKTIDEGHFQSMGQPMSQSDFKPICGMYIGDNPPDNPKAVA